MSEKKIKWGFIGCGEVTKYKSGLAFQKVEGSEVIAVMAPKPKLMLRKEVFQSGMMMPRN